MSKRRPGLQKEFLAIFKDVWIPAKRRSRRPPAAAAPSAAPAPPPAEDRRQATEMAEIAGRMKCAKAFECRQSSFERLCKAKIVGDGKLVECSPENRQSCEFRFVFVGWSFCKCPLRCYIARNLHK